jgi:integrase
MARRRYPPITLKSDGRYHAWVTVGTKPNGRPDQRHIKRSAVAEVEERIDELLDQLRKGAVVKAGRAQTFEAWMTTYLDTVAPRRCDPSTIRGYRSQCVHWAYPVAGRTRVDRVTPEQLDEVYVRMQRAGKADSSILKMHRIISRALEVALRRGLVPRNVAALIDDPVAKRVEIEPLTEAEALAILAATDGRRNAARWSVGLALGLRQGEALGLRWQYVDLAAGEIRVWWQLHRRAFDHGCAERRPPSGWPCGRTRGGNCTQRRLPLRSGETQLEGGLILKPPKGKSKRVIPIPDELVATLAAQREIQRLERDVQHVPNPHDLVFTSPLGGPVDPGHDHDEWRALLTLAGVRTARVHDGRHTAATLLLAQGVPLEVVQEILGHSDVRTTRGYAHVASAMARAATDKMGASLLRRPGTP